MKRKPFYAVALQDDDSESGYRVRLAVRGTNFRKLRAEVKLRLHGVKCQVVKWTETQWNYHCERRITRTLERLRAIE